MTQRTGLTLLLALALLVPGALLPVGGCRQDVTGGANPGNRNPIVRVRIFDGRDRVALAASQSPTVRVGEQPPVTLNLPKNSAVPVSLVNGQWQVGNQALGKGELTIEPARAGTVTIDGQPYRGKFRLVVVGSVGRFDVVNDVDVESYLMGVVAREMLANWDEEAYKAQAIVARTYALYEQRTSSRGSHWDLFPDERSQVYGGIGAETAKSRAAVEATAGIVVASGEPGKEKIFPAYFSSCCGGITQSAVDAFGYEQPHIAALADQNVGTLCSASPRFNWGPVVVRKDELTRRFKLFGSRRTSAPGDQWAALSTMWNVANVDVAPQGINPSGRPVRFIVTDARGMKFAFSGEDLRVAINTGAPRDNTVYSSFFKIVNDVDAVRFVDGHGWGHGVGMCQWCAQSRARQGMLHEDIVLAAFRMARLVKAY
jgi:stage II sporulation protein D